MKKSDMTYARPHEAGLASEARAVGKRIAAIIEELGSLDTIMHGGTGTLAEECRQIRIHMIEELTEEGWRCGYTPSGRYRVLPPKDY